MTLMTNRRSRTLAGVGLAVLGAFAAARASPPEVLAGSGKWDPRLGHRLEFSKGPPAGTAGTAGLRLSFAPPRSEPRPSAANEFYEGFLTRRVSALFSDEKTVSAADLANPGLRPWTGDPATVQHIQNLEMRAIGEAFQRYATDRLGIDRWSFPGMGRKGSAAAAGDAPRVRVRLGFSHLAPRADLLIPVSTGRVALSADARGRIGLSFEPATSAIRVAADVDVRERTATVGMNLRF